MSQVALTWELSILKYSSSSAEHATCQICTSKSDYVLYICAFVDTYLLHVCVCVCTCTFQCHAFAGTWQEPLWWCSIVTMDFTLARRRSRYSPTPGLVRLISSLFILNLCSWVQLKSTFIFNMYFSCQLKVLLIHREAALRREIPPWHTSLWHPAVESCTLNSTCVVRFSKLFQQNLLIPVLSLK
jgi:hypothetical protein